MNDYFIKIKNYRKKLNYTQLEMAKKIGCNIATYSRYEKGEIDIPTRSLLKIADIFHVSLDQLLDRDVSKKKNIAVNQHSLQNSTNYIEKLRSKYSPFNLEIASGNSVCDYVKTANNFRDCFTFPSLYNAVTYLKKRTTAKSLFEIFNLSKPSYHNYLKNGDAHISKYVDIAKDIIPLKNFSDCEIAEKLACKYPNINIDTVTKTIDLFSLRNTEIKYGNQEWTLDYKQFNDFDIYLIIHPESEYILGYSINGSAEDAYINALDNAFGLIDVKHEPGFKSENTMILGIMSLEYNVNITRYLISRYIYFYNNVRVKVYDEDLHNVEIPYIKLIKNMNP